MKKRIINRQWSDEDKVWIYTLEGNKEWRNAVYYELGTYITI